MVDFHIGEAASRSGLSIDAIRYYDSLGLLTDFKRDSAGRRLFDAEGVRWLVFLRQMRATGMPLARLQDYLRYREQGAAGVEGVLEVLRRHQEAMTADREQLDACLNLVEAKIAKYEELHRDGSAPGAPQV